MPYCTQIERSVAERELADCSQEPESQKLAKIATEDGVCSMAEARGFRSAVIHVETLVAARPCYAVWNLPLLDPFACAHAAAQSLCGFLPSQLSSHAADLSQRPWKKKP